MVQSPFPGMDPYLEEPSLWTGVHGRLMNVFANQLTPLIAPRYIADFETEIVIEHIVNDSIEIRGARPEVTVIQPESPGAAVITAAPPTVAPLRLAIPLSMPTRLMRLHIRQRDSEKLVAVVELLSPINKRPGSGRRRYLDKRDDYLASPVHLIEIDLLRSWPRMPLAGALPPTDYLIMVSNFYERPACDVWPVRLRQSLPAIPVPLLKPDPPILLDLGQALQTVYEQGRYDLRIDYMEPPDPPLSADDAAWAGTLLAKPRS